MTKKHSLKKILNESFWTDLAVVVATGGKDGVEKMIQQKLSNFAKKNANMDAQMSLNMIKRFKKMGLSNMWGENLNVIEKELTKRLSDKNKKNNTIDSKKLLDALGLTTESVKKKKNISLKEIFFPSKLSR